MMELQLIKEKALPLLSRKRVEYMATYEASTPSRVELKKEVAKMNKVKPELVIVRHIYNRYGSTQSKIIAHVYEKREMLEKLEGKKLVEKHADKVEKAEGEE